MGAQDLIIEYYNKTLENLKNYNDAKSLLDSIALQVRELQRQLSVHQSNNNQTDAAIVQGQLTTKQSQYDIQKIKTDALLDTYNESEKVYQQKRSTLLTADEQKDLSTTIALQNKATEAEIAAKQAAAQKSLLENAQTSFAQKNKSMLFTAGVIIVLLVVGTVIYIKVKAKKLP